MKGYIEVIVKDKDGKIVKRGVHEMHSFLNNFLRVILGEMTASANPTTPWVTLATASIIKTDGTSTNINIEAYFDGNYGGGGGVPMAAKAPSGDDSYGIVVGSGTTSFTLDQYNLISKISNGTGSGQLSYNPVSFSDLGLDTTVSPPVYRFQLIRSFANLSGGTVTINEVAIFARSYWKTFYSVQQDIKYIISRDVLPTSYPVPNGGSATVAITVEVQVG